MMMMMSGDGGGDDGTVLFMFSFLNSYTKTETEKQAILGIVVVPSWPTTRRMSLASYILARDALTPPWKFGYVVCTVTGIR